MKLTTHKGAVASSKLGLTLLSITIISFLVQGCAGTNSALCNEGMCSEFGVCIELNSKPACVCDEGYHVQNLQCVSNDTGPESNPDAGSDPNNDPNPEPEPPTPPSDPTEAAAAT